MPLYVRAGAILPLGPVKQYTDEPVDAPLTVAIYPGADGAFTLYEDDGRSFDYQQGDWMGIEMRWDDRLRRLRFTRRRIAHARGRRPDRSACASPVRLRYATSSFHGAPLEVRL